MSNNPPVIGFELGVGEFRIVTPEATYQIRVLPDLVTANTNLGVISPQIGGPQAAQAHQAGVSSTDPNFFQELSQELFESVGQLARQLSVSVGELPGGVQEGDLSKTGADLEDAKGQLEEVVELTEKASMTIMDLADQIQADMDNLNGQMLSLNNLESLLTDGPSTAPSATGSPAGLPAVPRGFMDKFVEIQAFVDRFGGQAEQVLEVEPEEKPADPGGPQSVVVFDLDVVFQTLYEFCTNESVKEHIKAMREANGSGGFNSQAVEEELSLESASLEPDDGFYNFPIQGLLKLLYSNTPSEDFKNTLKKMNQTVDSIFLEPNLPVEGSEVEIPAAAPGPALAAAPAAAPLSQPSADDMRELGGLMRELEGLLPQESQGGAQIQIEGYASIPIADRDAIVNTVASSEALIKNTSKHLTHIMEALSFQDLSGQRIKKIVSLISEIQVQLLSLLVSVNSKIKAHHEAPSVVRPKEERERVAQAEVDKMMEKLSAEPSDLLGPGAENRLDQGAVNDLLAQLGF
ncbi:MAG: protein phosphatase CheZ [Deltaproteobacteria bacterium]|jgi:chemotaxis protein CheZ|nr:protein phosphatase CheZ [Deltaproteobacteria bacterium]